MTSPPSQQIMVGAAGLLAWQPVDAAGEPYDPGAAVTVTVTDHAGGVVVSDAATTGMGAEPRTWPLPPSPTLDQFRAVWEVAGVAAASTTVDVVGGYWFTIREAVDADEKLADRAKYPTDRIFAVRAEVEAEFEEVTGQAWVPRLGVVDVVANGGCVLTVPHVALRAVRAITSIDAAGVETVEDTVGVAADWWGVLRRPTGWGYGRYRVVYEHGGDRPPPDLKAAAVTRLRHRLNMARSGIPDRATSMSTEQGQTFSLATPGLRGFVTGIPDVDVVLERYRFVRTGVT